MRGGTGRGGSACAHAHTLAVALRNATLRLGCGDKGVTAIKSHKWFQRKSSLQSVLPKRSVLTTQLCTRLPGFDWVKLLAKQMTPPHKPAIKDPFDKSNFQPEDWAPPLTQYHGDQSWCKDF